MSSERDEGPVYYREIQKNAYLKRIPNEVSGSKLRPLGSKKPPLKPMWTLFCVHNGRTPYLEQYPEAESRATLSHKPVWRACISKARHVTASVKPRVGDEYDFLIDTDSGPVRMLAPDWDSMQDWVTTLRAKLHELKILSKGENVYCSPPAPAAPRAAARDPTSPLPPTPPVPPDRVPGIEIIPNPRTAPIIESTTETPDPIQNGGHTPQNINTVINSTNTCLNANNTTNTNISNTGLNSTSSNVTSTSLNAGNTVNAGNISNAGNTVNAGSTINANNTLNALQNANLLKNESQDIDISNWDTEYPSLPSTSHERVEPKKSVTKICGQNICLDDSILKRNVNVTDSDEEFFAEIDKIHDEEIDDEGFKQRVVVNDEAEGDGQSEPRQATNITVIQVSNKPPHTAIPVVGPETDIFDFNFKQSLSIKPENFVNIVNTEINVQNTIQNTVLNENGYGTVFSNDDYGHLSLTTTVSLTGGHDGDLTDLTGGHDGNLTVNSSEKEGLYERLCMASTSNDNTSPLPVRRIKKLDKNRKSSLPNLDIASSSESTYEYLYPNQNNNSNANNSNITISHENREVNSNNSVVDLNSRVLRSNVERSHSQNTYDASPRMREQLIRRVQNNSPKREVRNDKPEATQPKPIWKRGLTELSLLTRLRGIGQKRQDSPTRHEQDASESNVTSPVKVVHRSRPEGRIDSARRRSSSLSNGQSPTTRFGPLQPLRARQAAALIAEQRRGACVVATISSAEGAVFLDYNRQVWVGEWGCKSPACGRAGDRVAAVRGVAPRDAHHAHKLLKHNHTHAVDILFHRVPLAKIYVLNKRDHENIGIKLDGECNIIHVESNSPAGRAGIPPPGKWAVTEVNNRHINLLKGGEEEMNRLSTHGTEVSILIQPSPLVKKIRAALKSSRPLLSIR